MKTYTHWLIFILLVFVEHTVQQEKYVSNEYEKDNPKCPLGEVVTVEKCGELGNNLWDYASVLAFARVLPRKRQPYISEYHYHTISRYFVGPLLPLVEEIPSNCSSTKNSNLKQREGNLHLESWPLSWLQNYNQPGNIVLHSPCAAVGPIMHEIDFIKSRLQLKPKLIEGANRIFDEIRNKTRLRNVSLTFVGVHVRRTDYLLNLKKEDQAGAEFFNFAFDYFRNRTELGQCVFVVISDDAPWVRDNILPNKTDTDVHLVSYGIRRDPGLDIAVYSLCNHTIFDYGSFGLWGAVYSGGEVVTTSSYDKAHSFIIYKNFHFFDPVKPDKELTTLSWYHKPS